MYALEKYHSCGSCSSFYTLKNSKCGFKCFADREDAIYARNIQNILSEYNLAPKVYSEVGRIRIGKKRKQFSSWGYITEIAQTLGCPGNDCDCGECDSLGSVYEEEINSLLSSIEDLGFIFCDAHIGNLGWIKRKGKKILVCIDTGAESVIEDCYSDRGSYSY